MLFSLLSLIVFSCDPMIKAAQREFAVDEKYDQGVAVKTLRYSSPKSNLNVAGGKCKMGFESIDRVSVTW